MNESLCSVPSDLQQLLDAATSAGVSFVSTPFADLVTAMNLARALSLECIPNRDEGGWPIAPDAELVKALTQCIEYFLPQSTSERLIALAKSNPELLT